MQKRSNSSSSSSLSPLSSSDFSPAAKRRKISYAGKAPEVQDPRIINDPELPPVPRPATPDLEAPIWEGGSDDDGIDILEEQQEKWLDWSYLEANPKDPSKKIEKAWKGKRVLGMG